MLDSNSSLFKSIVHEAFKTGGHSFCIDVYDGTMPDDAHILANQGTGSTYNINTLRASFTANLLGSLGFEPNIIAEDIGDDNVVIPLSDSIRELYVKQAGTATWFMLYIGRKTVDDPTTESSLPSNHIFIGNVGIIGSGADLELPDAEIALDRDYKCSDINISLF